MEYEGDGDTNYNLSTWCSQQRNGTETGRIGNKNTSGDNPNYNIIKIS